MLGTMILTISNPIIGKLADWSLTCTFILLGIIAIVFSLLSKVEEEHLID